MDVWVIQIKLGKADRDAATAEAQGIANRTGLSVELLRDDVEIVYVATLSPKK